MSRRMQVLDDPRGRAAVRFIGALFIGVCGATGACGGAGPKAPAVSSTAAAPPVAPAPDASAPSLARSAVRAAVAQGLGAFLQHVEVDALRPGGRFRGFRIAALRGAFWSAVDLKPGDVVTSVNGFPIERPEQAQTAFESLGVASELRVSYDRDGEPRELVYSIVDDH